MNEAIGITASGIKPVYRLQLTDRSIKATACHRVMTNRGFVRLDQLKTGDAVMCDTPLPRKKRGRKARKKYDTHISARYHPFSTKVLCKRRNRKDEIVFRIEKHRAIYEASLNKLSFEEYKKIIQKSPELASSLRYVNPSTHDIHHVDFDHYNNERANLACLTKEEHQKLHAMAGGRFNFRQGQPIYRKVKSIQFVGEEETYDIECAAPNHNFVANGIVVHNSGKTRVMLEVVRRALGEREDARCMILLNRVQLVEQTAKVASSHIEDIGLFCASLSKNAESRLTIGSVQSISRSDFPATNLIVVDEAHQIEADMYNKIIESARAKNPDLKLLGCTATPYTASGGYIYGPEKIFKSVTYAKSLSWMISRGYLVPPRTKHMAEAFDSKGVPILAGEYNQGALEDLVLSDNSKLERQVKDALSRLTERKKCAWACVSIKHAEAVYRLISEDAALVHSEMTPTERAYHMRSFEEGAARHMVFVSILSQGYDFPAIDSIVLMRPTRSSGLYVQTVGRGLRVAPGKQDCLVLDYGRVVENCGPLDAPYVRQKGSKNKDAPIPMKFCPACLEYMKQTDMTCPACGFVFEKPKKKPANNLTDKPHDGNLLGSVIKPEWRTVERKVSVEAYLSKKGNRCYRVYYHCRNLLMRTVQEYVMPDRMSSHPVFLHADTPDFADTKTWDELYTRSRNNLLFVDVGLEAVYIEWDGMFPKIRNARFSDDVYKGKESLDPQDGLLAFKGEYPGDVPTRGGSSS